MRFFRSLFGRREGQRGQSVMEALMAVAVLGIMAQTAALLVQSLAKQTVANRDRIFATEKALQMLEELRALVLTNNATLTTLDEYSDGFCNTCTPARPYYKWTLTTKNDVTTNTDTASSVPDYESAVNPLSANPQGPHGYRFVRYVDIISNTADSNVRTIYVRVYAAATNPGDQASSSVAMPAQPTAPPLAEVYGVVHSAGSVVTPDQSLDVYFVALENVPGWWSRTSNLIPLMQSSVVSLQAMNPGLIIRSHWIQTMSFGRDLEYTPEINSEYNPVSTTGSLMKSYVYPGYVDYNWNNNTSAAWTDFDYYYLPSWFLGRVNVGGSLPNTAGWPSDMISPNLGYAMADQFNHAMRYPDEQNLYSVLKQIAKNQNLPAPQISWRMLLELLNENDPSVQNAIILNLHGEMVPVPPLRNYSDAAKDPDYYYSNWGLAGLPGPRSFRAVSQPERLWYPTGSLAAVDVYGYDANPAEISTTGATPGVITYANGDASPNEVIDTITLFVPHANTSNLYEIFRTQGNSQTPYYRFVSGVAGSGGATFQTYNGGTVITDAGSATTTGATFYADDFTPAGRTGTAGLRIQLFGTTPTAREYNGGTPYSLVPSP
ncbi:MAG TPA: hypothetical protein VK914_01170 [bacterium]|jgi:hypothetical protein|nr:hypothetical protein [bacterium]